MERCRRYVPSRRRHIRGMCPPRTTTFLYCIIVLQLYKCCGETRLQIRPRRGGEGGILLYARLTPMRIYGNINASNRFVEN